MFWHIVKRLQSKLNEGSDGRNFCAAMWLIAHLERKKVKVLWCKTNPIEAAKKEKNNTISSVEITINN